MVMAAFNEVAGARGFDAQITINTLRIGNANVQQMQSQAHHQIGEIRIALKRVNVCINRLHRRKSLQLIAG